MFTHFLKIFLRTSLKSGGYSFINISGLAVGISCGIFIMLWVVDEISFDNFQLNKEKIYKVIGNHTFPDGIQTVDNTPGPLGPALAELPEVEASCRLVFRDRTLLHYNDKSIYENAVYADASAFKIFTLPILNGDPRYPLSDNNSVAISQKLARKYFNNEDPIGKVFRVNNTYDAKISAVFNDVPENSSLRFDLVIPYEVYAKTDPYNQEWGGWTGGLSFVKLYEGVNLEELNKKIHEKYTKPNIWVRWDPNVELFLYPMSAWRLHDNFENGKAAGGRITYVILFSVVAIFILLMACVNFMNLSTARSMNRAKEIGVRKVVGAARRSLISQLLLESMLISFVSLSIAVVIVHLLLPAFNELTGKQIEMDYTAPWILLGLIGITSFAGLIAGSYPAFLLSSFRPVSILKGTFAGLRGSGLRKALVVFQFSLSVMLIIGAVIVHQQVNYMKTKNLGFDKNNVFYINSNADLRKSFDGFKNEAIQNNSVKMVAQSDSNPMELFSGIVLSDNAWPGKTKEDNLVFKFIQCDHDLLPSLGFTFLKGRNFSREFPSDSNNYIINEEAARRMKLSDPIGQELVAPRKGQIVGIINDFHCAGLKGPIEPVIIALRPQVTDRIFVRYESGHLDEAMNHINTVYKKFEPNFPLEYAFMDESFGRLYQSEIMVGKLSTCFTWMAIFISCLGLFGLASFTAEKRTKEIGIRKVMGATVTELILLLCKDFIRLIAIALVIGLPLAWWAMQEFLSGYAFHTELGIAVFLITALSTIAMVILTVSYQSARTANANPVKSLRTE